MRGAMLYGKGDIRFEERDSQRLRSQPMRS